MATDNDNEEVKEFTQTVNVTPSKDDELVDEEEIETPESSSDEKKDPELELEETTEETPESEKEVQEEVETPKTEPKPVEGETPRERAMRLEMTRVKGLLRDQRRDELFVKQPISKVTDPDLADYDPEELKRFETLATKMGFAKKDEIIRESVQDKNNSEFETFIEAHPEYSPENDKDGALWNQFKAEFALYQPPTDPKTLKKVLNKVHNDVFGVQPTKNLSKINASQEKIKVASHTGASGSKVAPKVKAQPSSSLRLDAMKGFSEEEIAELTS